MEAFKTTHKDSGERPETAVIIHMRRSNKRMTLLNTIRPKVRVIRGIIIRARRKRMNGPPEMIRRMKKIPLNIIKNGKVLVFLSVIIPAKVEYGTIISQ